MPGPGFRFKVWLETLSNSSFTVPGQIVGVKPVVLAELLWLLLFLIFILKNLIIKLAPPILLDAYRKLHRNIVLKNRRPKWYKIYSGPALNWEILIDNRSRNFDPYLDGTYDKFIYDYLSDKTNLKGETVWDVGAFLGYHSYCMSSLVGERGFVKAFEPNPYNWKRFSDIIEFNNKLTSNVEVFSYALSDNNGYLDLLLSDDVDGGASTGSHLVDADNPLNENVYKSLGFKNHKVETIIADTLIKQKEFKKALPAVIKIDVEGAEISVLRGMHYILSERKPMLLMEKHTIRNMFLCVEFLLKYRYEFRLLHQELDGRCFIAAT